MPSVKRLMMLAVVLGLTGSLTGCASLRGGPPSCDGSARRPVGSVPDRSSFAPDSSIEGGHNGQN